MLNLPELIAEVRSGVFHIVFLNEKNESIASGSGFLSEGLLVTNNHVYSGPACSKVCIRREIDAGVNPSKFWGPLINSATGEVCGIVTRKGNGLSNIFERIKMRYNKKVKSHKGAGHFFINGRDIQKEQEDDEVAFSWLLNEIERSANVGIGYAFSIM